MDILVEQNRIQTVYTHIIMLAITYTVIYTVRQVLYDVEGVLTRLLSRRCAHEMNNKLLNHAINLDLAYYEEPEYYDLISRAQSQTNSQPEDVFYALINIIPAVIAMTGFIYIIAKHSIWYIVIVAIAGVVSLGLTTKATEDMFMRRKELSILNRRKNYYTSLMTDIETKILCAGKYFITKHKKIHEQIYKTRKENLKEYTAMTIAGNAIEFIATYSVFACFAWEAIFGRITIGDFTLYTAGVRAIANGMSTTKRQVTQIYKSALYIEDYRKVIRLENRIVRQGTRRLSNRDIKKHTIEFVNVTYRYAGQSRNAIENVSFKVDAGTTAAIVGMNGAGKTTLIKLLLRLYDADQGLIKIDGYDIREYEPKEMRKLISVQLQQQIKYALTIKQAVCISSTNLPYNETTFQESVKMSGVDSIAAMSPAGYGTLLTKTFTGESIEPSVGQWQKIGMARSYYHGGDILLLDEPSAALDAEAEAQLYYNIERIRKGMTTIIISHRLASVVYCDKIILLKQGKVVEIGTHKQLMESGGEYARMFKMQATAYNI